jgi:hypothetical protein
MDKLKPYLQQLKKHHFWWLCGLITLIAIITWWKATGEVLAAYKKNRDTINNAYSAAQRAREGAANQKYIDGLETQRGTIDKQVMKAWAVFGEKQRQFHWPKDVADIARFPVEKDKEDPSHHEDLRAKYRDLVVKPEWDRLFAKANLRRLKVAPRPAGAAAVPMPVVPGAQNRPVQDFEGIIVWPEEKRKEIVARYTETRDATKPPSWVRVRASQEDLWVYESVIDIINRVNGNPKDLLAAHIKRIEQIDVAQWAVRHAQDNPGGEFFEQVATPGGSSGQELEAVGLPNEGETAFTDKAILGGRYIDAKDLPVSYEAYTQSPPFTEFNQLFIVIKLVMDQRRLPELLAECANSGMTHQKKAEAKPEAGAEVKAGAEAKPAAETQAGTEAKREEVTEQNPGMPIEVRQVLMRFWDTDAKDADALRDLIGPAGERGPYDALVELRGIVYLYNNPDKDKLGKGSEPKPAQRSEGIPVRKPKDAAAPV